MFNSKSCARTGFKEAQKSETLPMKTSWKVLTYQHSRLDCIENSATLHCVYASLDSINDTNEEVSVTLSGKVHT